MGALGSVDVIEADTSFLAKSARPAIPGTESSFAAMSPRRAVKTSNVNDAWAAAEAVFDADLVRARVTAASVRSSTTLAALAHALESAGHADEASSAAEQALGLCALEGPGVLLDPAAARVALEVLFRSGKLEQGLNIARRLPTSPQTRLMVGAVLAYHGRYRDAHEFVDEVDAPERDAVLGYILLGEGQNSRAVQQLRVALRRAPKDADSAHNLAIGLWRLGSRRKAVTTALRAMHTAPGREDIALHCLELLLLLKEYARVELEVNALTAAGVDPSAKLLVVHARSRLGLDDFGYAERLLERGLNRAEAESDVAMIAEIRSNLIRLRASHKKLDRKIALEQLEELHREFPQSEVVVANLAQATERKSHAATLRGAFGDIQATVSDARRAFIEYQLATLEGDNTTAANKAVEWLVHEPQSRQAEIAAIVALGIGMERWDEASRLALEVLSRDSTDRIGINNAAYVLAMHGRPDEAISILEPLADSNFVLKATLGLAYLAAGEVERGLRLYREAADDAEKGGDDSRCLMTAYQAMVVRQLGILDGIDPTVLSAQALPPMELPDDWSDHPEFLRLYSVATRRGYSWPLEL